MKQIDLFQQSKIDEPTDRGQNERVKMALV
jgi:hypothetical protein